MDDIIDNPEVTTVRPEDDFEGFMNMFSGNTDKNDEDETDENEHELDPELRDEELPPSLKGKKSTKKSEEEEDTSDADEDEDNDEEDDSDDEQDSDEGEEDEEENDFPEDGLEVTFDTVITLPDGSEKSIEELSRGYAAGEELRERESTLGEREKTFNEREEKLDKALSLAKLEADDVIERFEGFDWSALLAESPEEFGKTKMFVERYQKRGDEIRKIMEERTAKAEEAKAAEVKDKAQACVTTLSKEIPGWSSNLYNDILSYAVEKGTDPEFIQQCTDPGVLKAFYQAMRFDRGENIVKAKIKRATKAPTKTLKANNGAQSAPKKKVAGLQGGEVAEFNMLTRILNGKS